jgi:hypothetical protein
MWKQKQGVHKVQIKLGSLKYLTKGSLAEMSIL